ncbi:GIY-YIG nuclease family protein [Microbacterium sp.]|uniref:GIY-YIG nuclease family protein n=1 Tax=Microbacterium sp. TaxID=51671 RepID=UPI003A8C9D07
MGANRGSTEHEQVRGHQAQQNTGAVEVYVLYRLYAMDSTLLYVGVTNNVNGRMREHSKSRPWWGQVHHSLTQLEWFRDIEEASAAEIAAIANEHPVYNVASRPGRAPSPYRKPRPRIAHESLSPDDQRSWALYSLRHHAEGVKFHRDGLADEEADVARWLAESRQLGATPRDIADALSA